WIPASLEIPADQTALRILVTGEGGSGKTHVALRVAQHLAVAGPIRRLPVLIGREIDTLGDDIGKPPPLIALLRAKLDDAFGTSFASTEFIQLLLAKGRLLVVFDGVSEYSASVRQALQPNAPDFPVAAFAMTTRDRAFDAFDPHIHLSPNRISGSALPSFLDNYLRLSALRDCVSDHDLLQASLRLSGLGQRRSVTPLLARLFAEQLAAGTLTDAERLSSAELMLSYVKDLNAVSSDLNTRDMFHASSTLAYHAVFPTLQPTTVPWDVAVEAVGGIETLEILRDRLNLIATVGLTEDRLAFSLDPVAEYLAALYLVDKVGQSASNWSDVFHQMAASGIAAEAARGFLSAVNDVYAYRFDDPSPAHLDIEVT
ncbi:MAG: hypothetical protein F6K48_35770, partial [Okeania sp. SIO3H1]|nr:hypothetical protein [Okeania sp. SIO3H1]